MPRKKRDFPVWRLVFVAALLAGVGMSWRNTAWTSDGDDAMLFYEAGMRTWSEVIGATFLPPGIVRETPKPDTQSLRIPEKPLFVFDRWRPFGHFLYMKALWSLGLSPTAYRVLNWVVLWISSLALSWGMLSAISTVLPMTEMALYGLASVLFLMMPTLFTASDPFFFLHLPMLFCGLAMGLVCQGGARARPSRVRIAIAAFLGFLACQTHENAWWYLTACAGWLAIPALLRKSGKPVRGAPRFWWPLALMAAHILVFRSLLPSHGTDWGRKGFSGESHWLWTNFSYLFLSTFNGLAQPLVSALGSDRHPPDVTMAPDPWALLFTLGAIAAALWPAWKGEIRFRREWKIGAALLAAMALASILPYCLVRAHRFVHYTIVPSTFLAVIVVTAALQLKRRAYLPVALLLLANTASSGFVLSNWNWLELNVRDARAWTDGMLRSRPELAACTPEQPCCMTMGSRMWGRNEWVLSWNLGHASKQPAFIPEGWPGANCARHLRVD